MSHLHVTCAISRLCDPFKLTDKNHKYVYFQKKLFIDTKNGKPISHAIKRTLQKENAMNNIFLVNKF